MLRQLRAQYPDARYHILSQRNGRGDIIRTDADGTIFSRPRHQGVLTNDNRRTRLKQSAKLDHGLDSRCDT